MSKEPLTPREIETLAFASAGLMNKQIAFELGVSEPTIKAHMGKVLHKLGVPSRVDAVLKFHQIDHAAALTLAREILAGDILFDVEF
jgi:DNA-binding NarL/FixJ family response regulator